MKRLLAWLAGLLLPDRAAEDEMLARLRDRYY